MWKKSWILFPLLLTGCAMYEPETNSEEASNKIPDFNVEAKEDPETFWTAVGQMFTQKEVVSFMGVGDNLIHSQIFADAQAGDGTYDFKPMYEGVAEEIAEADLAFINQETILGGDELGFSGYPAFNTPSDMAQNLVDTGFDLVNGATNHSLDRGTTGALNNVAKWKEYKEEVLFTGMYDSAEARDEIPVVERNGVTFSFLGYTYGTNGIPAEYPYLVNFFDRDLIKQDVERAKEVSDFVIVSAHWGDEHTFAPNAMQEEYAQLFADLEVDVVVGTHPHTIHPVEWLTGEEGNETLIIYSLGNFIASTVSDINLLGGMVSFDFVMENEEKSIENVLFEPLVIHYETDQPHAIGTRRNFSVHKLADYTEDQAQRHGLNGYNGNQISLDRFWEMTRDVVEEEFLEIEEVHVEASHK